MSYDHYCAAGGVRRRAAAALFFAWASASALAQAQPAGPAPVPAAVAIARPTSQEIDAAQRALAAFTASTDAATRAILAKYPDLLAVRPPQINTAVVPSLAPPFQAKHQANLEVARRGGAELLLVGDSITDFWRNADGPFAGKPVLDRYFGDWNIANFGIAGDTTQGVLYRLQNGEGEGFEPRAVMLMIGTNNTRDNTAPEIAEGIGAVVLQMRTDFPAARILLLGVFPRGVPGDPVRDKIAEVNRIIATLDDRQHVFFLDIGRQFLDDRGVFLPDAFRPDNLHPQARGYEIWGEAVKETLATLLK